MEIVLLYFYHINEKKMMSHSINFPASPLYAGETEWGTRGKKMAFRVGITLTYNSPLIFSRPIYNNILPDSVAVVVPLWPNSRVRLKISHFFVYRDVYV